jgi:hypothetical protein
VKALSIRQPWAWFILNAGKNVENRGSRWVYRGPVLIHVGASLTKDEYRAWRAAGESMRSDPKPRAKVPEYSEMQRGGFVGIVRITGCSEHPIYDRDPAKNVQGWRMGSDEHGATYGYDLADVQALPFVPAKGALGIYVVEHRPGQIPSPDTPYRVNFGAFSGQYLDTYRRLEAKR